MFYADLSNNLLYVMKTARVLNRKQVVRFFEQENNHGMINWVVRVLIAWNRLDYNEMNDRLAYHGSDASPEINEAEKQKRIKAFWVIADVGSENVNQIFSLSNGNQFFFDSGEDCYELTVVDNLHDAMISMKDRDLHLEKDVPSFQDKVVRIAIVDTKEMADQIGKYGFDAYCILDDEKRPVYGSWDDDDEENEAEGEAEVEG